MSLNKWKFSFFLIFLFSISGFALADEQSEETYNKNMLEAKSTFKRLNKEYKLKSLVSKIRKREKDNSLKLRTLDVYKNTIFLRKLTETDPTIWLAKLKNGNLPYYSQGDFDCDSKLDKAIVLSGMKTHIFFGSGEYTTIDFYGEALSLGMPGKYGEISVDTAPGDQESASSSGFVAKCNYLIADYWEKSTTAYVYDPKSKTFSEHVTAD